MTSIRMNFWNQMPNGMKIALGIVLGIIAMAVFAFLLGWLLQILWNATVASMFGWPEITFWQALGIFILAKLVFGFGVGGSSSGSRQSKSKKVDDVPIAANGDGELTDLTRDASFRRFWESEGRDAWEAFQNKERD